VRPRVGLVSQWYDPEVGSASRHYYKEHLSRRHGMARLSALLEQASRREWVSK
jgi:hypothetical protein